MENIFEKNVRTITNVNSLMIAIVLTSSFISIMFAALGIVDEGFVPILLLSSLAVSYFTVLICKYKSLKLDKYNVTFIYYIFIVFLLSFLYRGIDSFATTYFIEYLAFGIIIYLFSLIPFSTKNVIYFTMLIGNLILLNPIGFVDFISLDIYQDRVKMGATYAMLPSIVATIIFFFFMRKERKRKLNIISYLSNGYLLLLLVTEGTRGAVVAIILLISLVVYIKISQRMTDKQNGNLIYPIFLIFINFFIILVVLNVNKILFWVNKFLQNNNIHIATVTKTINMIEKNGLVGALNSRNIVYEKGFRLFEESPLWGHGIGSYADIHHGTYPHNLFLQLLIEGGLLFTLPFIFIFVYCLWLLLKPWSRESIFNEMRLFVLFLFIICIPELMFSSYLWREQSFWLLFFILLSNLSKSKSKSILNVIDYKQNS